MKLNTTNSGHYILPLDDVKGGPENENQVFVVDKMLQDKDFNEKEITRIHRNLGHPSRSVMEQMLKNSECFYENTPNILNKLYQSCMTCLKFKKSIPRPKISPPMASNFKDCVCMDLKIWPKYGLIIL